MKSGFLQNDNLKGEIEKMNYKCSKMSRFKDKMAEIKILKRLNQKISNKELHNILSHSYDQNLKKPPVYRDINGRIYDSQIQPKNGPRIQRGASKARMNPDYQPDGDLSANKLRSVSISQSNEIDEVVARSYEDNGQNNSMSILSLQKLNSMNYISKDFQLTVNHYKRNIGFKRVKQLENKLFQCKLLLNMIIHDMRNPTQSIKVGLD